MLGDVIRQLLRASRVAAQDRRSALIHLMHCHCSCGRVNKTLTALHRMTWRIFSCSTPPGPPPWSLCTHNISQPSLSTNLCFSEHLSASHKHTGHRVIRSVSGLQVEHNKRCLVKLASVAMATKVRLPPEVLQPPGSRVIFIQSHVVNVGHWQEEEVME